MYRRGLICLLVLSTRLPAAQDAPDLAHADAAAVSALRRGDAAAAESLLRAALESHPGDPALLGLLGVALDGERRFSDAEGYYRQALHLAPSSVSLLNNYGNHLVSAGREAEARSVFLRVLALDRAHANALEQLARMAAGAGAGPEALAYLRRLPPGREAEPEIALLTMRAAYLAGETARAEALRARLSPAAHDDEELSLSLALALAQARQYERAEECFARALELAPARFDVLYNLGLAAAHAGHRQRAYEVLTAAERIRPDDVDVLVNLATLDAAERRYQSALVRLARAARDAPARLDVQRLLAQVTFAFGDYGDSAAAWSRCAELEPEDDGVRRERGFTTALAGDRARGLIDLDWYVARHPRDATGEFEDGVVQSLQPEAALRHLDRAIALKPDLGAAYYARGVIHGMRNQLPAALSDLAAARRLDPENAAVLSELGNVYLEMERPADALAVLERAAELDPHNGTILFRLARSLALTGRREESSRIFVRLRALGPQRTGLPNPGFVRLLADSPERQYESYRSRAESAVALDPGDAEAKLRLLKLDLADQSWEKAERLADEIAALHPPASLLREAGRALLDGERYRSARELLEQCSQDPDAAIDLGIAIFYADGAEAGLRQMEQVPAERRDGDYHLALAQMLDRAGRPHDAVRAAEEAMRTAPARAGFYRQLSLLLLGNGRTDEALALLAEGVRRFPDDPTVLLTRAIAQEVAGQTDGAEQLLRQAEGRWPEWSQAHLVAGIILETHHDSAAAERELNAAIALGARDPEAWYSLAEALIETRPDDLSEAGRAIAQALALDPDDPWTHALAGRIHSERREYEEAVGEYREAIRLRPAMVQAHYNLAQALKALGRSGEARAEAQSARELKARFPNEADDPDLIHSDLLEVTVPDQ